MRVKAINKKYSQQLAENLQALLDKHNLNISQLAQALNLPMMTIRRLISGETIDPRISTLKLIANYFDISIDTLLTEIHQSVIKTARTTTPLFLPILDWHTAEKTTFIKDLDLSKWKKWQSIISNEHTPIGENAFALESRPSMYPRFPKGAIFIIDPDAKPSDGDLILIRIKKNNELTLKELIIDPPEWQLHPIVPGSNMLLYSERNYKIVGVNLLTMLYNRD